MPRRWLHPRDNQSTFQLIEAFRTLSKKFCNTDRKVEKKKKKKKKKKK